jgi:tetratricopeptide (TPR) repeat protein
MVQGQVEDREEAIKHYMKAFPEIPSMRATLANLYFKTWAARGRTERIRSVAAKDFADLPRDGSWVVTMANLAYVCSYLQDVRRAGVLYGYLLPHSSTQLVIGSSAIGVGSIDRFLGILATTLGRWDDAECHFESALEMNERVRSLPYNVFTEQEYGAMLLKRDGPGDREKSVGNV